MITSEQKFWKHQMEQAKQEGRKEVIDELSHFVYNQPKKS